MKIQPGVYEHFKGNRYRVIGEVALDESVTGARIAGVLYVPLYGEGEPTVRTFGNFTEVLDKPGYSGPRFKFISE